LNPRPAAPLKAAVLKESVSPHAPAQRNGSADRAARLRRFLEAYWLRPENALWMALRSESLSRAELPPPTIDVCCGDGVFLFLHLDGRFDLSFDVFRSVADCSARTKQTADMFDFVDDRYAPRIVDRPSSTWNLGLDSKPSMLSKAASLDLYESVREHDCNLALPLHNDSFRTMYCNAAYWVKNIDSFLRESARVVRPDGRIILHVKLDSLRRYTLESHRALLGDRFLEILDRGRVESWPSLASRKEWETRFAASGLSIESATPFITRTHAHLWDIGLRPIAPMLVKMTDALNAATRAEIKRDWVELFMELLRPFFDPSVDLFAGNNEPGEIQYILRKV